MTGHGTGTRERWRAERRAPLASERDHTASPRRGGRAVSRVGTAAVLLFAAGAAVTIAWCASMSAMGGMPMPGGWTMSMAWMRMPGQTWTGATASFVAMWVAMTAAMMTPSLAPALWRYHRAVDGAGEPHPDRHAAAVGAGYFAVWTLLGLAVHPSGLLLADAAMRMPALSRAVPLAAGVVVVLAGALQLTRWKARHLACSRAVAWRGGAPPRLGTAWRDGLRLGAHCTLCCAGPMAILLVVGVMDLRAMAVVTAAVTAERLAPAGARVARATGVVAVGAGLRLVARAAGG